MSARIFSSEEQICNLNFVSSCIIENSPQSVGRRITRNLLNLFFISIAVKFNNTRF